MTWVADLHIHSHYSRATSKDLTIPQLYIWAQRKGIHILATGDIAHPGWVAELMEVLEPAEEGLYQVRPDLAKVLDAEVPPACRGTVRFILGGEISNIYKKNGRVRKIHTMVYFPTFEAVRRFQARLERIGNIHADGRPILGLDARDLLEIVLETDPQGFLIPAHIWTPWFSLLGSRSGFDSVEECFEDLTPHIFALETGLSSDPPMNWRVSALDRYTLVSASDAHSPQKLGREATLFATELSYAALRSAMQTGDPDRFKGTIEFFPEEGKYHFDGHRKCGVVWAPRTTREHQGICPVCGKPVTVGVMHRVEELADRPEGARKPNAHPFYSLIPLPEILAELLQSGVSSKRVQQEYERLLSALGPELYILMEAPLDEIRAVGGETLAMGIDRMRRGEVIREPGFDGQYGTVRLFPAVPAAGELPAEARPLFEWEEPAPTTDAPPPTSGAELPLLAAASSAEEAPTTEAGPVAGDLNPEQRRALEVIDRPLLIVAGPGTGKTLTLTARIAWLVTRHAVPPESILAITFTNKAAAEMRQRLQRWLGADMARAVTVATFHAFAAQVLRTWGHLIGLPENFVILDEEERLRLLRRACPDLPAGRAREVAAWISRRKQDARHVNVADEPAWEAVFERYEQARQEAHALDFDDLLREAVRLLEGAEPARRALHARFRWISVDEYQDVNELQYRLLRLLAAGGANVCAIGDPDQAIYGFRGANRRYFLHFTEDFPGAEQVRLTRNYRSTQTILDAAFHVIRQSPESHAVRLVSHRHSGPKIHVQETPTERGEAEFVVHTIERLVGGTSYFSIDSGRVDEGDEGARSFGDIAVLYRTRGVAEPLEEALHRAGIPYQTASAVLPTRHPRVQDVLAHLWVIVDPEARHYRERVWEAWGLHRVARLVGEPGAENIVSQIEGMLGRGDLTPRERQALHALLELWDAMGREQTVLAQAQRVWEALVDADTLGEEDIKAWNAVRDLAASFGTDLVGFLEHVALSAETDFVDPRADRVALLTLHAAKGLEFPVVFIVGCEEGILPLTYRQPMDLEEERRLFYVGMTRARDLLFLTFAKRRMWYGQLREQRPSRFLEAIPETLKVVRTSALPRRPSRRRDRPEPEQLSLWPEDA